MSEVETIVEETIAQEEQLEGRQEPEQESEQQEESEKEKYSKRVQKRIDKLEWEKNEERRRAYALEQEIAQLKAPQQKPQQNTGEPKADDFPAGRYDPDYLLALTEYKIQQSIDNLQKYANVSEQRKLVDLQQQQARQTHDDYDDVTSELLDHPLANDPVFNDAILASDNVAEVAYYLGKNPDQLDHIATLQGNPAKMLKYIGRIEAMLENQKSLDKPKPVTSNAPRPIAPVGSAKPEPATQDPNDMPIDAYIAMRKAQKRT